MVRTKETPFQTSSSYAPKPVETPQFSKSIVQSTRTDGYWVETFWVDPIDKAPGLIGYTPLSLLLSPLVETNVHKVEIFITHVDSPVAVVPVEIAGSGRKDVVICYDFGKSLLETNPHGGNISWLENPGRRDNGKVDGAWASRFVGRWEGMYRLKAGYFTQKSFLEVVGIPIVHGTGDIETPIPIILFQKPEDPLNAFESLNGRDSLFVASREGITWLYYESNQWKRQNISPSVVREPGKHYYGSACVDVAKLGSDPAGYALTVGPFHVTGLVKKQTGPNTNKWVEFVLDTYGTPEQLKQDGKGDGDDECLVALFGPSPHQGVYYYKLIDAENGIFAKWKVAEESAGRIAIGDFNAAGKVDFATIVYNVPGHYEGPNPKVHLYLDSLSIPNASRSASKIISTIWAGEPLLYLPKPSDALKHEKSPLLEIAGYRVDLEVLPPKAQKVAGGRTAVKVLYGDLLDQSNPSANRRALNVPQYQKDTTRLGPDSIITTSEGVIFLSFTPVSEDGPKKWKNTPDVPVKTLFQSTYDQLKLPADFKFIKVEDLPWGGGFKGMDFWNLTGVEFRFLDKTPLCHLQFWTAGKGISAGVHNHQDVVFLEVHVSISAGTGNGGMWRVKPGVSVDPKNPNDVLPEDFEKLPLADWEEQGGFWDRDCKGNPIYAASGAVSYPWHKWQAGTTDDYLDIWAAVEFNPHRKY
ncbi:hypothetical protein C7212DRAFT_342494 [Tuber magnatum]|uniref:Uncharacterized protein n=1 Tax=Tuber magnatum TaxID=42249 RepID=A0A317STY8_9PEZI|nr:hypothetical protein C7212DRAFT_342494 [Tuber magnatum]